MANATGLALVTGASSGIGFDLAKLFADDGYDLVIAGPVQVDLRKPEDVQRLYRSATADGRSLAAAALNAGVGRAGPFVDGDLDTDLGIVDLNVRSTVHLAKLVLTDMAGSGTGKVLFTKDDPAAVAKQGYDALMRGDRKVVAESALSKAMGVANRVLPDSVKAVASRMISLRIGHER